MYRVKYTTKIYNVRRDRTILYVVDFFPTATFQCMLSRVWKIHRTSRRGVHTNPGTFDLSRCLLRREGINFSGAMFWCASYYAHSRPGVSPTMGTVRAGVENWPWHGTGATEKRNDFPQKTAPWQLIYHLGDIWSKYRPGMGLEASSAQGHKK